MCKYFGAIKSIFNELYANLQPYPLTILSFDNSYDFSCYFVPKNINLTFSVIMNPLLVFERLFFAVFGQTTYDELIRRAPSNRPPFRPSWTDNLFKIVFGVYMLVSVVVLINLLIAMMSDTYQRIQVNIG